MAHLSSRFSPLHTDRYNDLTDDDELEGQPGWQRVFVVVCIGYYTMACVMSVFIMFGMFDYLKRRPDAYSSASSNQSPPVEVEDGGIAGGGGMVGGAPSDGGQVTDQARFEALAYGSQADWDAFVRSSSFRRDDGGVSGDAVKSVVSLSGKAHLSSLGRRQDKGT